MANYNSSFIWFDGWDITHSQSRAINVNFLRFLPINVTYSDSNYLVDLYKTTPSKLAGLGKVISDYSLDDEDNDTEILDKIKFIFPSVQYKTTDGNIKPSGSNYNSYLENCEDENNLYKNITCNGKTDIKYIVEQETNSDETIEEQTDLTEESTSKFGSITVDITFSNNDFGNINGEAYIDGIVLFGRKYVNDSNERYTQEKLENLTPIGMILFTDDRTTEDDKQGRPKSTQGTAIELNFTLYSGTINSVEWDEKLKDFAGTLSIVNDGVTSNQRYTILDRKLEAVEDELSEEEMYLLKDKLYMADDAIANEDLVDVSYPNFGRLNIFNDSVSSGAEESEKDTQLVLGRIAPKTDKITSTTSISTWDCVAASYWGYGSEYPLLTVDGISKYQVGVAAFTDNRVDKIDLSEAFTDFASATEIENVLGSSGIVIGCGTQNRTTNSFTTRFGSISDSVNVTNFSDSEIKNSYNVFISSDGSTTLNDKNNSNKRFVVDNSSNITIFDKYGTSYGTILDSENILINDYTTDNLTNSPSYRRIFTFGAQSFNIEDSDFVMLLNTKGVKGKNSWVKGSINHSKNVTAIGGTFTTSYSKSIASIGCSNEAIGKSDRLVESSILIGTNNSINSNINANGAQTNIITIGDHLSNDTWQQFHETNGNTSFGKTPTLILGYNNNTYSEVTNADVTQAYSSKADLNFNNEFEWNVGNRQYVFNTPVNRTTNNDTNIVPSFIKQIVVGGVIPDSKNPFNITKYNALELSVDNLKTNETILSLYDIKGRGVEYTSRGINIGVLRYANQQNMSNYGYSTLGSINWAKLAQLLYRLKWETITYTNAAGKREEKDLVVFDSTLDPFKGYNFNDPYNLSRFYTTYHTDENDKSGSNRFLDLVRQDIDDGPAPRNWDDYVFDSIYY